MKEKRICHYSASRAVIGLRRNQQTGEMMIGGQERFVAEMKWILQVCFETKGIMHTRPSQGKLRMMSWNRVGRAAWSCGLRKMESYGWILKEVTNMGRLMR